MQAADEGAAPLLQVRDLAIAYETPEGWVDAVRSVSFDLAAGGALALVGESGSGKTQTALAIPGLLPRNARIGGSVRFAGQELLGQPPAALQRLRGAKIAMVFQDPLGALNPHLTIGTQMAEVLVRHAGVSRGEALREAARMLDAVRIADAGRRLFQYPHECSGGMRQRICIGMALLCRPQLLIADEPTTALDVTVQAQILRLLADLRRQLGLALLLVSHDLGVVAAVCEQMLVLQAGAAVEAGPTARLLARPAHPHLRGLLEARLSL